MQIYNAWLKDIPQQFLGKHNIEVLITAFAQQMQEIEQVLEELNTKTDLDNAIGTNLDYVGTIIPLTRKEAGELAGIGVSEPVMSDERYRQFLRYKNLKNTNCCTYYDLMDGISLLWKLDKLYYLEDATYPATIIFRTDRLDIEQEDTIEFHSDLCIRAAGVGVIVRKNWQAFITEEIFSEVPHLCFRSNVFLWFVSDNYLDGMWILDGSHVIQESNHVVASMKVNGCATLEIESEGFVIIEKDVWRLTGENLLSGVRILDATIYEVEI